MIASCTARLRSPYFFQIREGLEFEGRQCNMWGVRAKLGSNKLRMLDSPCFGRGPVRDIMYQGND
jgi:hypothetical protein